MLWRNFECLCSLSKAAYYLKHLKVTNNSAKFSTHKLNEIQLEINIRHEQAILKNLDFYEDPLTKYVVFTKLYHLKRQKCCGSACRHSEQSTAEQYPILIVYGSQTGTAEEVAERIAMQSRGTAFKGKCMAIDDYEIERLVYEKVIIFVCATTGQGEPPDNMKRFWRFIMRKNLPLSSLNDVQFAVLGLGDSSYAKYNFIAKKLDKRLANLGGQPFCKLGLADDQHDWGPDAVIDSWTVEMWRNLINLYPISSKSLNPLSNSLPPARFSVSTRTPPTNNSSDDRRKLKSRTSSNCRRVTVKENVRVTSESHFQETRLIKFDISPHSDQMKYLPGDVAMILPSNTKENVDALLDILPQGGDVPLYFEALSDEESLHIPQPITLRSLATDYLDFMSIPRRSFFQFLCHFANDENERDKLKEFGSPEGTEERYSYANRPRRTILEVLQDFHLTCKDIPLNRILDLIPLIRPRAFSIASSPSAHSGELHILVAVVRYKTRLHRPRQGLCSTWLSTLTPGMEAQLWVKKGGIRFPENLPCILIGPGTGIAPFRSVAHERSRHPTNDTVVAFGCRYREHDFYFEDEWSRLPITFFTAFSRDQEEKVYVQDVITQNKEFVWSMVDEKKAAIYIAGNSKNMPDAVKSAFLEIFRECGNMTSPEANDYLEKLQRTKRYQQETWS